MQKNRRGSDAKGCAASGGKETGKSLSLANINVFWLRSANLPVGPKAKEATRACARDLRSFSPIAMQRGCSITSLIREIRLEPARRSFSFAVRIFVFEHTLRGL
jgi:hypothetical protein